MSSNILDDLEDTNSELISCWIIGKQNEYTKKVQCVCYVVFIESDIPPVSGWSYVGIFLNKIAEVIELPGKFMYSFSDPIT